MVAGGRAASAEISSAAWAGGFVREGLIAWATTKTARTIQTVRFIQVHMFSPPQPTPLTCNLVAALPRFEGLECGLIRITVSHFVAADFLEPIGS